MQRDRGSYIVGNERGLRYVCVSAQFQGAAGSTHCRHVVPAAYGNCSVASHDPEIWIKRDRQVSQDMQCMEELNALPSVLTGELPAAFSFLMLYSRKQTKSGKALAEDSLLCVLLHFELYLYVSIGTASQ